MGTAILHRYELEPLLGESGSGSKPPTGGDTLLPPDPMGPEDFRPDQSGLRVDTYDRFASIVSGLGHVVGLNTARLSRLDVHGQANPGFRQPY